jgi:hypothetical protein
VAAHRDASKIAHFKCGYPRAFCGWSTTGAGARPISHHAPRRSEDWWNSGPNPKTSNECRPSTMLSRVAATQRITGCADPALDDARCLHRYNKCCQPTSGLLKKSFRSADHESLLYDECGLAPWLSTRLKGLWVGTATIQRIEKSRQAITGYVSTLIRIQAAFEQAGIQFIDDAENGGYGLCLKKRKTMTQVSGSPPPRPTSPYTKTVKGPPVSHHKMSISTSRLYPSSRIAICVSKLKRIGFQPRSEVSFWITSSPISRCGSAPAALK